MAWSHRSFAVGRKHDPRDVPGHGPYCRHEGGSASRRRPSAGRRQAVGLRLPADWLRGFLMLFHNGDAKHALQSLPPEKLNDALAITFCTDLPIEDVDHGREAVSKIVQLRLRKDKFLEQAEALMATNVVY